MDRLGVLLIGLMVPLVLRADEAVRRNGTRESGKLTLSANSVWHFQSRAGEMPVDGIELVRLESKPVDVRLGPLTHQIRLIRGQVVHGQLLKLDADHLHVKTAWTDSLAIPRSLIERVCHVPRSHPVLFEPFTGDLRRWKITGDPKVVDGQLTMNQSGQRIELSLRSAVPSGRIDLDVRGGRSKSKRVTLVLGFIEGTKTCEIRVELMGPGENWAVASPTKAKNESAVPRDGGAHRLRIEFSSVGLHVFLDQLVVWSQGPVSGELRSLAIHAEGEGSESAEINSVLICRDVSVRADRSWADLAVDGVRSVDGDETYGNLLTLSSNGIEMDVRKKRLVSPWPDVSELAFRRSTITERKTNGEHIQVRLRSIGKSFDVMEGSVRSFDSRFLILSHSTLGELQIPRDRVAEIRPRFHGVSLPIDATPRHLGRKPAFGFAVVKPEGTTFRKPVHVSAQAKGFIVIDAANVGEKGSFVEVLVDGQSIGKLSEHSDRVSHEVRSVRLPLPARTEEKFELEIRISKIGTGWESAGIDLRAVRLEITKPR